MKRERLLIPLCGAAALLILLLGVMLGSVPVAAADIFTVIRVRLTGAVLPPTVSELTAAIIWKIRLPRVLMAFLTGAALALSGTVMQSALRNPLASSYTLGVSSGASLVAALVMVSGFSLPWLGGLTLPLGGFIGGLLTVFLSVALALRFDANLANNTIILTGMVLSLFVNSLLTVVTSFSGDSLKQLIFWQMGSFSSQSWQHCGILLAVLLLALLPLLFLSRELDLLSFGEEQACSAGVDLKKVKLLLFGLAALLTGAAVCFVGVIGFIDLVAPHIVRSRFDSRHSRVLPLSALFGGGFMVLADLLSRSLPLAHELPVGAVTALIGAPFFIYVFFHRRKGREAA